MEAPTTEFQWINIENLTEFRACRNSIQGALLIVDERGEELFLLTKEDLFKPFPDSKAQQYNLVFTITNVSQLLIRTPTSVH